MVQYSRGPGRCGQRCVRALVPVLLTCSSCWVTLDPTVLPGSMQNGGTSGMSGAGASGDSSAGSCTFAQSGASSYWLCSEPLPQAAAEEDCSTRQATLAIITSPEENDWFAAQARAAIGTNAWLGGMRDDELAWRWTDGMVFWRGGPDGAAQQGAFVRWEPGEPNNSSTVADEPERCLAFTIGGDDWNDRACSLALPYACER